MTMQVAKSFLRPVAELTVPATTGEFIFRDHFCAGRSSLPSGPIVSVDQNFVKYFSPLIEPKHNEQRVVVHEVVCGASELQLIDELGGCAVVNLTTMCYLAQITETSDGARALRLNSDLFAINRNANLCFVRDHENVVRAVRVSWDRGWCLKANAIDEPGIWSVGIRVLSLADVSMV